MTETIYTIGHSTHSIGAFVALLEQHNITAVCDVRSRPYSRMNPQFNRESLKGSLRDAGIKYVFLGKELGARSEDKHCYRNGQVQYDLLAETALFKRGIDRVVEGARQYRIALMCAEKEPLDCHRAILVARKLSENGTSIKHILGNGEIEDHAHAIDRLIDRLRMPGVDMFREHHVVIADAYARQGNEISYREETAEASNLDMTPDQHESRTAE